MGFINWTELDSPQELITVGTIVVAAVVGYVGYFWGNFRGKSVKLYKERLDAVEKETEACFKQHKESLDMINHLQGQVDVLKDIPLIKIGKTLDKLERAATSQARALDGLPEFMQKLADSSVMEVKSGKSK